MKSFGRAGRFRRIRFPHAARRALLSTFLAASLGAQTTGVPEQSAGLKAEAPVGAFPAPPDVSQPPADAVKMSNGIATKVIQAGSGNEHPSGDDCVVLVFTAWARNGSLFSMSGPHGESAVQCLVSAMPGVSMALKLMVTGEKRRLWLPADFTFAPHHMHAQKKALPEEPAPRVDLTIDVELIHILKAPVQPEDLKNPPLNALRTSGGVCIRVLKEGVGTKHPAMDSHVTLYYTGWTAAGTLFESNVISGHPADFLLGTVITGWREVLPLMITGEKVRIWVPARLGYGDDTTRAMGPPGDLVYDIELLAFR